MKNRPQQVPPGTNPLLGRFDLDPGKWRPLWYYKEVSVGVAAGALGTVALTINNQPYLMTRLTHSIIGPIQADGSGYLNDGQYDIEIKDEQSNYQNQQIPADLMFGSMGSTVGNGFNMEFPYPLPFAGNKTILFRVTNRVTRVFAPVATTFVVGLCLHGIADWGDLQG